VRWLSRLVTLLVIAGAIVLLALLIRRSMPSTHVGQHFKAFALFRDGSRLADGSPVMIAGVRVGEVERMSVEGVFARVDLELRDDTKIPTDSWVTKRAESAFGDSYVEIIPTGMEGGAPTAQILQCCPNGDCDPSLDCCRSSCQLTHVLEGGSTDTVLRSIASTMPKIDRGLDTMHEFAMNGRKWTTGTFQDVLGVTDHWLAEGNLERPIEATDRAMARFEDATARAANAVASAEPDVNGTLDRWNRGARNARTTIADLKSGLHEGFSNARDGIDKVDPTIDQLADVMTAVNEGKGDDFQGRLGRLVNDPGAADTIEDFTDSAKSNAANFNRLRSWLGFRYEFNLVAKAPRVYVTAEIRGRNDKFYLIEFERGPLGALPADELLDQAGTPAYKRVQEIRDALRFTAEFGKRFGWLQVRGGLKESTFGLGADALLYAGRLRLSTDAFGSFQRTPRVKLAAAFEVFRSVYLLAGVDDALNRPGYLPIVKGNTDVPTQFDEVHYGRDYFVGATLQFTDADLATILRVYGALIVGLL
jgi:phospholipid/cholesterol/gamma-HCH transport system substrate-binding protein